MQYRWLLICVLLIACQGNQYKGGRQKAFSEEVIEINPGSVESPIPSSSVFNSVVFIPLETTRESIFSTINRLAVTDKYFIIYDEASNAVYFFLKDGKFLRKISNANKSIDSSYEKIGDFFVNVPEEKIFLKDIHRMRLITYDFEGNRLKEESYPFAFFLYMSVMDNHQYYYMGYRPGTDCKTGNDYPNLVTTDSVGKVINCNFNFDSAVVNHNDLFDTEQSFYVSNQSLLFSYPYSYSFFQLKGTEIVKKYNLSLPEVYQLPGDFLVNAQYRKKRLGYLYGEGKEKIWNCTDFFQTGDFISCNLQSMVHLNNTIFYDKKNRRYIRTENIGSDKKTFYLPLFENKILAADERYLYSAVSSKLLFESILITGKTAELKNNEPLNNFFATGSNLSNPVITQLELKEF